MDTATLHDRTVRCWVDRVAAVRAEDWGLATPCAEWTVRALVNHVTAEELWAPPLLRGQTVEQVGSRFDGSVLGQDPVASSLTAAVAARDAVTDLLPRTETVHLSYGEERAEEYVLQLCADHLVHAWDLAAATGGNRRLDSDLVVAVAGWFAEREEMYRSAGAIGERAAYDGHDAQGELLVAFGRDPTWRA